MKVLVLGAANSIHTVRWVNALAQQGLCILLVSQQAAREELAKNIGFIRLKIHNPLGYYLNCAELRQIIREFKPNLLHAHYASGYGTLARKVNFHPILLSVWGSDVFHFPQQSTWHQRTLEANLNFADCLASTSGVMRKEIQKYSQTPVKITPFGIDLVCFIPRLSPVFSVSPFRIGTIKTLADIYGIDLLIRAFALARQRGLPPETELVIVGSGPAEGELKKLASSLHLSAQIQFIPAVAHAEVPALLRRFDLYVALSRRESFGVAVLEASACGLPVLVSDAGGLPEVVLHGETGLIVPVEDPERAAEKMIYLATHPEQAQEMGKKGRIWVAQNYAWASCVEKMQDIYHELTL